MKLRLIVSKNFEVIENGQNKILEEHHYLCLCKRSKVIYLGEIVPEIKSLDEDILCDKCRFKYDIKSITKASELVFKEGSEMDKPEWLRITHK